MVEKFFAKFPTMVYQNTICVDITRRAVIRDAILKDPRAFYGYTIPEGARPDNVAETVYEDSDLAWLVYMSIGTVDPYYAWPLSSFAFENFIDDKYGSAEIAQQTITGWRIDWDAHAEESLSPSGYGALPEPLKKYYSAKFGAGNNVLAWVRRREDWEVSTNMIVTWQVANSGTFQANETVELRSGNTVEAQAVVSFSNSTAVMGIHVSGNIQASNTQLVGLSSNAVAEVTEGQFTANVIPIDERPYWSPVYAWDREQEANAQRRVVNLIDPKYKTDVANQLRKDLNS